MLLAALRVLAALVMIVGLVATVFVLLATIPGERRPKVLDGLDRDRRWWMDTQIFAAVVAAFFCFVTLSNGFARVLSAILGRRVTVLSEVGSGDSEGSMSLPFLMGLIATLSLAAYVGKMRETTTRCWDLEQELRVQRLLHPPYSARGHELRHALVGLRARLPGLNLQMRDREALQEAIARVEREIATRGSEAASLDVPQRIIGKRITSFVVSEDGAFVHMGFTDNSCLVLAPGHDLLEAQYVESVRETFDRVRVLEESGHRLTVLSFKDSATASRFNDELLRQFVGLWTKAGHDPGYDKQEWSRLNGMLEALGVRG